MTPMETVLAKPFVVAAVNVLQTELGSEVQLHDLRFEGDPLLGREVAILVGVTGGLKGILVLTMSRETAGAIAGAMMGEPPAELDEIGKSAVAELGNMIAGAATVRLEEQGFRSNITPPSIVTGKDTSISTMGTGSVVVPLTTTYGEIAVHVALRQAA